MSEMPWQRDYNTLLDGADRALGGNRLSDNGADHEFIDYDCAADGPDNVGGPSALYFEPGEVSFGEIANRYQLPDLAAEIGRKADTGMDADRAGVIKRVAEAARLIIEDKLAEDEGRTRPSFEEMYGSTTGEAPNLEDTSRDRQVLKDVLAQAGYKDVTDRNLLETVNQWRATRRVVDPSEYPALLAAKVAEFKGLARKNVLSKVDFGEGEAGAHLENVPLTNLEIRGLDPKVKYTGFSLYKGGEKEGKPQYEGVFGINPGHGLTEEGLIHLLAHEGFPGHHLQNLAMDAGRRSGRLGFEAAMGTMYTPFHTMQEGWAQNVIPFLAEGGLQQVAEKFGPDLAVELALIAFQDAGKHDASILHQLHGRDPREIAELLRTQYFLSPAVVRKLAFNDETDKPAWWTIGKPFGPMVGPTYRKGSEGVRKAGETHGLDRVLPIALHAEGLVDMPLFQEKLRRAATLQA